MGICQDCIDNKHKKCKKRNKGRAYSDCYCQHRKVKVIVRSID